MQLTNQAKREEARQRTFHGWKSTMITSSYGNRITTLPIKLSQRSFSKKSRTPRNCYDPQFLCRLTHPDPPTAPPSTPTSSCYRHFCSQRILATEFPSTDHICNSVNKKAFFFAIIFSCFMVHSYSCN